MAHLAVLPEEESRALIEQNDDLRIVAEPYGYSVRPGSARRKRATMVEGAALFMGFGLVFGVIALVASPNGLGGWSLDVFEIGLASMALSAAIWFFWFGARGSALEVQVDHTARELRTALRNWRGADTTMETFKFEDVESVFVHRATPGDTRAQLCIGTYSEPLGIELIEGGADELGHLYKDFARGMRPQLTPEEEKAREAA